jgi:GGDEF domain-containing protein
VKQWDNTWDVIVNQHFLKHKLDYELDADIFSDSLVDLGGVSLRPATDFKFAGGWFTVLSADILKLIGIPDSFGHYGMEDTFIVEASKIMRTYMHPDTPVQYVMENHIVGETYVHRCNSHMKKFVVSRNRKEEFRNVATRAFGGELVKFRDRVIK